MSNKLIALSITVALGSVPYSVVADDSCKDVGALTTECYTAWENIEQGGTRADSDMAYATFKASYLGTLTEVQLDGIIKALNSVVSRGSTVVHSFDADPTSGSAGFTSVSTSVKGFYADPSFSSGQCTVTFGTVDSSIGDEIDDGVAGSVTCPVEAESTSFGTPPTTYTIEYDAATLAALAAADANATAANFDVFVTQLFTAMSDQSLLAEPGGVFLGDATTNGIFGLFKISPTTGNWSYSGTVSKVTYSPDA